MMIVDVMDQWMAGEPVWPYARIIEAIPSLENWRRSLCRRAEQAQKDGFIKFDDAGVANFMSQFETRDKYIRRFGFAIPCQELLDELAKNKSVVEIGAGSGYMTHLMRLRGIDVTGSDHGDPGLSGYGFGVAEHDAEQIQGDAEPIVRDNPDAAIFCSWPSYQQMWFLRALKAMNIGQTMVVIREDACAEEKAWNYLDKCFDEVSTIDLPNFQSMNDYVGVYLKRAKR